MSAARTAIGSSAWPAGVKPTKRFLSRTDKVTPSSGSSIWTCRLSAGCDRCRCAAERVRLKPWLRIARIDRSCCRFTGLPIITNWYDYIREHSSTTWMRVTRIADCHAAPSRVDADPAAEREGNDEAVAGARHAAAPGRRRGAGG